MAAGDTRAEAALPGHVAAGQGTLQHPPQLPHAGLAPEGGAVVEVRGRHRHRAPAERRAAVGRRAIRGRATAAPSRRGFGLIESLAGRPSYTPACKLHASFASKAKLLFRYAHLLGLESHFDSKKNANQEATNYK